MTNQLSFDLPEFDGEQIRAVETVIKGSKFAFENQPPTKFAKHRQVIGIFVGNVDAKFTIDETNLGDVVTQTVNLSEVYELPLDEAEATKLLDAARQKVLDALAERAAAEADAAAEREAIAS